MNTLTTHGITISVESFYQASESMPSSGRYIFSYRVTIKNNGDTQVQLLRRKWLIQNGFGDRHIVEGEGVIGKQPIISPGEAYSYHSWCPLGSPIGRMQGFYQMKRPYEVKPFNAFIPAFTLVAPLLNN